MRISYGWGGWIRVDDDVELGDNEPLLPGPLYLRLRPFERGRWRVTEFYLDGRDQPITAEMLRELALSRIESVAQADGKDQLLARRDDGTQIQMSVLASYYAAMFTSKARHWVADMWHSQLPSSGVRKVARYERALDEKYVRRRQSVPPLRAPEGRLTDDFLHDVARAYAARIELRDQRPAVTLAEQASVSPAAVRKWIYTARKRGIMPPGLQGKAG